MKIYELNRKINNRFGNWKDFVLNFIVYNSLKQKKFSSLRDFLLSRKGMIKNKIIDYFINDFGIAPVEVFNLINNVKKRNNFEQLEFICLYDYLEKKQKRQMEESKRIARENKKQLKNMGEWEEYQEKNKKTYSIVMTNQKTNFIEQYSKIQEEVQEIWDAVKTKDKENLREEICDSIFALTKLYYTVNEGVEIQETIKKVEQKNKKRGYYI